MSRDAIATIDLSALQHNVIHVKRLAPSSRVIAMLKANAYGHGLVEVASVLSDVDAIGVCCLEEALVLKEAGVKNSIILMEGFFNVDELKTIAKHAFDIVVHHPYQVDILEKTKLKEKIKVWLKVDTGMHRLGIDTSQLQSIWKRLRECENVDPDIRLMTHFACANDLTTDYTRKQYDEFKKYTQHLDCQKSLANSAAILAYPHTHADWVRPGIMLYGISPFQHSKGSAHGLKPVMTFSSKLIAINEYQKGDSIGYGATWTCPEAMKIGVVAIGYGDGYPYKANGTSVMIHNKLAPIVGAISMDMTTIDLRQHPEVQIGDEVVLWGEQLPVEVIAKHTFTIAYELVCNVTARVRYRYIK